VAGGQTLNELRQLELLHELYDYAGADRHLEPESVHHRKIIQNGIQDAVVEYNVISTLNIRLHVSPICHTWQHGGKHSEVLVQSNSITNNHWSSVTAYINIIKTSKSDHSFQCSINLFWNLSEAPEFHSILTCIYYMAYFTTLLGHDLLLKKSLLHPHNMQWFIVIHLLTIS